MTTKRIGNGAALYRIRKDPGHVADSDPGLCSPIYRGFRLACTGGEIPALQRRIDAWWNARHAEASTPSEREAFDILERGMRFAPRDWQ